MKLLVTAADQKDRSIPEGVELIKVGEDLDQKLNSITDNSCTEMILEEVFENSKYEDFVPLFNMLINKIRLGGQMLVVGIDLLTLSDLYNSHLIDEEIMNRAIFSKKSLHNCKSLIHIAHQRNLNVASLEKSGFNYKLILTRLS